MTSDTVVTLDNLPSFVLKLTIFTRLRLEKIIRFQDFTRADYVVQRPAFGHYLINKLYYKISDIANKITWFQGSR